MLVSVIVVLAEPLEELVSEEELDELLLEPDVEVSVGDVVEVTVVDGDPDAPAPPPLAEPVSVVVADPRVELEFIELVDSKIEGKEGGIDDIHNYRYIYGLGLIKGGGDCTCRSG